MSDAVEVVYDALKTPPSKGVLADTVSLAIALVRDIPSVQPEQHWIPCSERLPDKGLCVLMQLDNIWQIVGWYDKDEADWYELMSEKPLSPNFRVLAWMPLPEPFVEGEKR